MESLRHIRGQNLAISGLIKRPSAEAINQQIRRHEETVEDWEYAPLARELYRFCGIFGFEFKLKFSQPVIAFRKMRRKIHTDYISDRSGFGTKYTIAVNIIHRDAPFYRLLRGLLHELIHIWQESYGRTPIQDSRYWYHNKRFIDKAKECGLVTDHYGHDLGHTRVFSDVLKKYGIDVPAIAGPPEDAKVGSSKMRKWTCGCTKVRCVVELHAQCLECGREFQREGLRRLKKAKRGKRI